MAIIVLGALAIICLYAAVDHAITNIYHYKYSKNILNILKDSDTRQLFVYLRPYLSEYIDDLRKNTETYADMGRNYKKLLSQIMREKDGPEK